MLLLLLSLVILAAFSAAIILLFQHVLIVKKEQMSNTYAEMDEYDRAVFTKHPAASLTTYSPFITAASVFVVATWLFIMMEWKSYEDVPMEIVDVEAVQDVTQDIPITDPPPKEPVKQNKPRRMEVVEELEVDSSEVEDLTQVFELPDEIEFEEEEEEEVYIPPTVTKAEDPAEFPGGKAGFKKYISENFHVCQEAIDAGKKGMIMTNFVVNEYGRVVSVQIEKSVYPCLDDEAKRVIESSPAWKPGKVNGRPVREKHKFPVVIRYD